MQSSAPPAMRVDPRAQVITSAGAGSAAAIAINADLVQEDVERAVDDHPPPVACSPPSWRPGSPRPCSAIAATGSRTPPTCPRSRPLLAGHLIRRADQRADLPDQGVRVMDASPGPRVRPPCRTEGQRGARISSAVRAWGRLRPPAPGRADMGFVTFLDLSLKHREGFPRAVLRPSRRHTPDEGPDRARTVSDDDRQHHPGQPQQWSGELNVIQGREAPSPQPPLRTRQRHTPTTGSLQASQSSTSATGRPLFQLWAAPIPRRGGVRRPGSLRRRVRTRSAG
jgi:hypothetical protein